MVYNTGKVTLVDASTSPVTLTATATFGTITKTATTSITVSISAPVASVAVAPATWTMKAGQTRSFTASALDASNGPALTTIAWSSSDASVATVDTAGVVTAKNVGTVVISASSANGQVGKATVTVISAAALSVNSGKTSLALGMQTQFFFSGTDVTGKALTSVTWTTSNAWS